MLARRRLMGKASLLPACLFAVVLGLSTAAPAAAIPEGLTLIHESAHLGPVGQNAGFSLGMQFLGSRFHVNSTVEVAAVGGALFSSAPPFGGPLFAAVVSLSNATALPSGDPFDDTKLAETLFEAPRPSADLLIPLSVTLSPGDYALVFGGEQFDPSVRGGMTNTNVDIPGHASYFRWDAEDQQWQEVHEGGMRFVVATVPEPSSVMLLLLGVVILALTAPIARRHGDRWDQTSMRST